MEPCKAPKLEGAGTLQVTNIDDFSLPQVGYILVSRSFTPFIFWCISIDNLTLFFSESPIIIWADIARINDLAAPPEALHPVMYLEPFVAVPW